MLFQDNQSAVKIDKNGKKFCTRNYRQIDICYFFSKDRIKSNKISIDYCNTEHMLTDFLIKALQRSVFVKIYDMIMGCKHIDTLLVGLPSTNERVGNLVKVGSK